MDRCYSDCQSPDWYQWGAGRRWSVENGALLATVHVWRTCRSCAALSTESFEVARFTVATQAQLDLVAA